NNTCSPAPATLAPTQSCTLTVRFEPTTTGDFVDSFDIPSDDPDEPSVTVSVSGTGVTVAMPDIRVTDSIDPNDDLQLPYGNIWEFFTIDETISVTNDGNADLVIGTIAAPAAPFAIVSDPCSGQTLAPSTSCIVDVSFTAATLNSFNDTVEIPSNDPDEATVTVSLSGTGIPPQVGEKLSTEPSGSNGGFFGAAVDLPTLVALLLLIGFSRSRRLLAPLI
ncbi:MAG: choice-of-anchor D domain-containing protein, partial [Gammaproteobacteria bacterium]